MFLQGACNFECLEGMSNKQDNSFAKLSLIAQCDALVNAAITLTRISLSVTLGYQLSHLLFLRDWYVY